ncbi:hypothetical protein MCOR25_008151 [Pyricularia grisea]|nr:hypothetical protein MCOR25_008151 [Pyricularia grisea]
MARGPMVVRTTNLLVGEILSGRWTRKFRTAFTHVATVRRRNSPQASTENFVHNGSKPSQGERHKVRGLQKDPFDSLIQGLRKIRWVEPLAAT